MDTLEISSKVTHKGNNMKVNNMKVRVIKPIKGLEVGDILTYNNESYNYELTKENSDITETTLNRFRCKYSFGEYTIKRNSEYFKFIDDDNIPVTLIEGDELNEKMGTLYDVNPIEDEDPKDKVISDLKDENKKLQDRLDSIKWISKDEYNKYQLFMSMNDNRYRFYSSLI
jgi:hypothetical protein